MNFGIDVYIVLAFRNNHLNTYFHRSIFHYFDVSNWFPKSLTPPCIHGLYSPIMIINAIIHYCILRLIISEVSCVQIQPYTTPTGLRWASRSFEVLLCAAFTARLQFYSRLRFLNSLHSWTVRSILLSCVGSNNFLYPSLDSLVHTSRSAKYRRWSCVIYRFYFIGKWADILNVY